MKKFGQNKIILLYKLMTYWAVLVILFVAYSKTWRNGYDKGYKQKIKHETSEIIVFPNLVCEDCN